MKDQSFNVSVHVCSVFMEIQSAAPHTTPTLLPALVNQDIQITCKDRNTFISRADTFKQLPHCTTKQIVMYLFCINEHLRFTDFQYNSTKI